MNLKKTNFNLPVAVLASWALFMTTGLETHADEGPTAEPETYFELSAGPETDFEGELSGRAYAEASGNLFAIGGRSKSGEFSTEVQILEKEGDAYVLHRTNLPEGIAFAGAVGHGGAVYLAGGLTPEGPSDQALKLTWADGVLSIESLPPLPQPVIAPGLTTHRSTTKTYLYVVSGLRAADAEAFSSAMVELPISDYVEGESTWTRMDDLPFGGRIGAAVCETYNEIVVSGGWRLKDGQLVVAPDTWGFARVARDGHAEPGWVQRAGQPAPVALPAFSKSGQGHLLLAGGNAANGRLDAFLDGQMPVDARAAVWSFHDPTDTWHQIGELSTSVSGGILADEGDAKFLLAAALTRDGLAIEGQRLAFTRSTKPMKLIDWAVIIAYFLVVASIGAWFARKQNSAEEFALGNRNVKWWADAIRKAKT